MIKKIIISFLTIFSFINIFSQDNIYEDLLEEEVEVENPVYMPVLGFGMSMSNYYGELNNAGINFNNSNPGLYINISTFFDKDHFFKVNFNINLLSKLHGSQTFFGDSVYNFNFETSYTSFGINMQYSFEHFIKSDFPVHPFVKVGAEYFSFTGKTDMKDENGQYYVIDENGLFRDPVTYLPDNRDYEYETDLREAVDWGLGDYTRSSFAIPVDLGLELKITERSYLNIGYSIHFAFSDLLDHISSENTRGIVGDNSYDRYHMFYAVFNYDLFSDAESVTVKKLFADIEFDYTMYGDEDNDWVFDKVDECPGTPKNVEVDSLGCPLDNDMDGVPDYLDKEPNTSPNVPVDDQGKELSVETILKKLNSDAVSREEVENIIRKNLSNKHYAALSGVEIPKKFKPVDTDNDGMISYEEFIKVLDNFFEFDSPYSIKDLEDLKKFFFAQ